MPQPDEFPPVLPHSSTQETTDQHARVTVIVPAYNYGHYLSRTIESVLRQTFANFQLLIVDDGSTDETAAIADNYAKKDPRIRCIRQKNAGLSAARNTGLRTARTEYVTFLDADDELMPTFLERCVAAIESLPPDYAMVACGSRQIDQKSRPLPGKKRDSGRDREISRRDLILKNRFPCNVLVRRNVFAQAGEFDSSLTSSEDRDMWIRIAQTHRIFRLAEPLVSLRTHPANMSRNSERMRSNMRKVIKKALSEEQPGISRVLFRCKVAAYFHYQNAWMRHQEGRPAAAIGDMLSSILLWPIFFEPAALNEPILFRLRGLARFLLRPESKPVQP